MCKIFIIFASVLMTSVYAIDLVIKHYEELDEAAIPLRDECLQENSITIDDLKAYETVDDVPERDLCFYKCFFTKIGVFDENQIYLDKVDLILQTEEVDDVKRGQMIECLGKIDGGVQSCNDIKALIECCKFAQ